MTPEAIVLLAVTAFGGGLFICHIFTGGRFL